MVGGKRIDIWNYNILNITKHQPTALPLAHLVPAIFCLSCAVPPRYRSKALLCNGTLHKSISMHTPHIQK